MNLIWKQMGFAKGKTAMFKDTKLVIIRHKRNVWAAYVGNRRLTRFKIKEVSPWLDGQAFQDTKLSLLPSFLIFNYRNL